MPGDPPPPSGKPLALVGLAAALLVGAAALLPGEAGEKPAELRLLACLEDAPSGERWPLARRWLAAPSRAGALHALAWCQRVAGKYRLALASIQAAWLASSGSDPALRAQLEGDLPSFFADLAALDAARGWGEEAGLPGLYPAAVELYAERVASNGYRAEAIGALRALLRDRPLDPEAPRWSYRVIELISQSGSRDDELIEVHHALDQYGADTLWAQVNDPAAVQAADSLLSGRLNELYKIEAWLK